MADRFADLPDLLARVAADHVVPGVAVGAVVDGALASTAVHGHCAPGGAPVTPATRFRWYSISKPLTTLALLRLRAAGRLDLDAPLRALLPDLAFADPVATALASVRDCLLHRTGLGGGNWTWHGAPDDTGELLRRLPHFPCAQGFRTGYHYQNLHFAVLGAVFAAVGTDWAGELRALLAPAGVAPACTLAEFQAGPRALGCGPNGFAPAEVMSDLAFAACASASAACGTIGELATVAALVAAGGALPGGGRLLPASDWAEAVRPVLCQGSSSWPEVRQGAAALAGRISVYRGETLVQWAGGFLGYVSHLVALPERRAAACALANRTSSDAAEALAFAALDRAAGWQPLPWPERFLDHKRRARARGGERLRARLARPAAPWPLPPTAAAGRFRHRAYGDLDVVAADGGARLRFRGIDLPLVPRADGSVSADGNTGDFSELCWDLHPAIAGGRVAAWGFNPDDAAQPVAFAAVEG